MHRIFQAFIDRLAESADATDLRGAMADAASALDLRCFAYLALPDRRGDATRLVSNYPTAWTAHYLERHYERLDPVIIQALAAPEPFGWGPGFGPTRMSRSQCELFVEASFFGIRHGFTVPIHDSRGMIAAVTFATDERQPAFEHCIENNGRVLQLMAMYFHAHARRKLVPERRVDGVLLSAREFECLEWAAQGKSAWETGRILGISRRKSKDALLKPDPRNDQSVRDAATGGRSMQVADLHALMQPLELEPSVPENIRQKFDTARNAFIYSWFDYDL